MTAEAQIVPGDDRPKPKSSEPLFSVIIPTYNRATLVPRAIESVLNQSFDSFELLVLDDGSTDDTAQRVAAVEDPRVRYFRLPRGGAARAQNIGAQHATGVFLIFLDSDDEALPGWLSTIAQNSSRHVALISTDAWSVDETKATRHGARELAYPGSGATAQILSGTYAIRRSVFESIGGFDDDIPSGTKTDLSIKLVKYLADNTEPVVYIDTPLVLHHRNSPLSVRLDDRAVLEGAEILLERYASELVGVPKIRADFHGVAGVRAVRIGNMKKARQHFLESARDDPTNPKRWIRLVAAWIPWADRLWKAPRVSPTQSTN